MIGSQENIGIHINPNQPESKNVIGLIETKGKCQYAGVTSSAKDQQKLMNSSMSDMIDSILIMKYFNSWFDNYSFAYVPDFCKPLIKRWVFSAYKAGIKSNDK